MALYKRGDVWWYEFVFNGERIRESSKVSNRRAAEQIEAARRTELAKGEVGIKRRKAAPTLRQFADRFIEAVRVSRGQKTASWYAAVLKIVLDHAPIAETSLDDIDKAAVDDYAQHRSRQSARFKTVKRKLQPATINREIATIRRMLKLAEEWSVIDRAPKLKLLAGEQHREFILTRQSEAFYLAASSEPLSDVAAFLLDTGFRVGEAVSLEWPQVRLDKVEGSEQGIVTVLGSKAKSKRTRHVPLTARAAEILRKWRSAGDPMGPVFHDGHGKPLLETTLAHQHKRVRTALKMPVGFVLHSLRHTYGTRLGESGADAFTIMKLMGHASVTTSQRYVHPTPESMELAVRRMESAEDRMQNVPTKSPTVDRGRKRSVN